MNRAELVAEIAKQTGQSKASVKKTIDSLYSLVTEKIAKGEKVTLVGFGTFERRMRKPAGKRRVPPP